MDLHHILPQVNIADFTPTEQTILSSNGFSNNIANDTIMSTSPPKLTVPDLVPLPGTAHPPSPSPPPQNSPTPSPHSEQWWAGKYDFAAKIIILGDYGVGKTTFLTTLGSVKDMGWCRCVAFKPNEFVEMECSKNDKKILIRLMDTGGQERFRSMTSSYFRGAHGCLLMFNVTNEDSFNNVINWFNDLGVYAPPDNMNSISTIVVGNVSSTEQDRHVTAERAFRLAESLNLSYCETHMRDEHMALCILTRLMNNVIVSRARRQSLAITIMPTIQVKAKKKSGSEAGENRKWWKCCKTS